MLDQLGRPARLRYLSGSFHVLTPGEFVNCAVTGKRIPLPNLRYWSSEVQEAYLNAEVATARYHDMKAAGQI